MIDIFPFLRSFPKWTGAFIPPLLRARSAQKTISDMYELPVLAVQEDLKKEENKLQPSFVSRTLQELDGKSETGKEDKVTLFDIKASAATQYAAGQETTWATLSVFVLAMVLHREVQEKAREEVDRVIGKERLPDFGDREKLEYVEGVVQEVFRWAPVFPLGIPHKSSHDDVYNDMFIPKAYCIS